MASNERLIRPHVRRTPVIEVEGADLDCDPASLVLKLELHQHAGSFKTRGAFTHLLTRPVPASGVVAASGGNHGVAVAYAAHKLGIRAAVFVPTVASPAKVDRIRGYGAHLVVSGDRYDDSLAASEHYAAETGALPIHAFDQPETLLGQGTVGLEFEQQAPALDTLLFAVGGGGLIGGIAAWYAGRIRLLGVEPESCPTLAAALDAGRPVDVSAGGVAADSLGARRAGALMFPLAQQYVDRVVLVPDEAIRDAQQALWSALRIAAEPGGATALAALRSRAYQPRRGERVGVLVCGGNVVVEIR
ncbi:MAG: threonine/serine dehydratase [Bryobacteraceae bacterium]